MIVSKLSLLLNFLKLISAIGSLLFSKFVKVKKSSVRVY